MQNLRSWQVLRYRMYKYLVFNIFVEKHGIFSVLVFELSYWRYMHSIELQPLQIIKRRLGFYAGFCSEGRGEHIPKRIYNLILAVAMIINVLVLILLLKGC